MADRITKKATRAMYSGIGTIRKYELPVDIQLQMYNSMIVPIATYACEIWGIETIREIEIFQKTFLKHVLLVHKRTYNNMIYGETGMYPIELCIKNG